MSASDIFSTSRPWSRMWPPAIAAARGSRRITAMAVIDLPEPLSPTSPTTCASSTSRETRSTTRARPRNTSRSMDRSSMLRSGKAAGILSSGGVGVENVAHGVTDQIQGQHDKHYHDTRQNCEPPGSGHHECSPFARNRAQLWSRRPDADADKAEASRVEDRPGREQAGLNQYRRQRVGQHMEEHDPPARCADRA